nr:beta-catenin-like protein 1 [Ipomoea batatas]
MNEVDAILQAVVAYKSKNPKTADKEELVENLFDSLCCLLMPLETKERFVKSEGVELMIIIMNQKKLCYGSTIRALDFAMTNYPPSCCPAGNIAINRRNRGRQQDAGRAVAGARRRSTTTRRLLVSGFVAVASARTQDEDLADLDAEQPDEAAWDDEDRRRFCV